jgi:hypothetical protein
MAHALGLTTAISAHDDVACDAIIVLVFSILDELWGLADRTVLVRSDRIFEPLDDRFS